MARGKKIVKAKWKGKKWYNVVTPDMFGETVISETPAADVAQVKGRTITVNASNVLENPSKYYFKLKFRVTEIDGETARTKFIGHECSRDFLSRMVRRYSKRVDVQETITLEDGTELVAKLVATTIRPTAESVQSSLRVRMVETLENVAAQMDTETFVREMLDGNIQKAIRSDAAKVYPLREVEIRRTELVE